jgi:hypothetical protein
MLMQKALSKDGRASTLERKATPLETAARSKQDQLNRLQRTAVPLEAKALSKQGQANAMEKVSAPLESAAINQLSARSGTTGAKGQAAVAASETRAQVERPPPASPARVDLKA